MAILTGYQKVKKYVKESTGFRLMSNWTNANTVELDDGSTLQTLVSGLGDASKKNVDTSIGVASTSVNVPTSKAVADLVRSGAKEVTASLASGATTLTISDTNITTDSTIDVYSSVYGINPTAMTVAAGSVTLTYDADHVTATIKIRIS